MRRNESGPATTAEDSHTVEDQRLSDAVVVWIERGDEVFHRDLGPSPFYLGSAASNTMVIPTLEANHLQLWTERGRVFVESQGAPIETTLNGTPLPTGIRIPIKPQDALLAGDVSVRIAPRATVGIRLRFELKGGLTWEHIVEDTDFTIGRARECAVTLPRGRVSREHLRVVYREGKLMVIDLRSTTGTSVNHERLLQAATLAPGDIVGIDGVRIEMSVSTDRSANPFDDAEPPAWLFDGEANDRLETLADGLPVEEALVPLQARFALDLRFAGTELGVYEVVDRVVVGRAEDCSLSIDTPALSPKHARFEREGAALFVHDLGTSRGTYVNGRRVVDHTALLEGDRVELGPVTFVVIVLDPNHPIAEPEAGAARSPPGTDRTAEGAPVAETIRSAEPPRRLIDLFDDPPTLRTEEDDR